MKMMSDDAQQLELFSVAQFVRSRSFHPWEVEDGDGTPPGDASPQAKSVWSKPASEVTPDSDASPQAKSVWSKSASEVTPDKSPPTPHWVETYSPANRLTQYYRYVWMEGQKMFHRHVRGGNASAPKAIANREAVERAIACGATPQEIERLIKEW